MFKYFTKLCLVLFTFGSLASATAATPEQAGIYTGTFKGTMHDFSAGTTQKAKMGMTFTLSQDDSFVIVDENSGSVDGTAEVDDNYVMLVVNDSNYSMIGILTYKKGRLKGPLLVGITGSGATFANGKVKLKKL